MPSIAFSSEAGSWCIVIKAKHERVSHTYDAYADSGVDSRTDADDRYRRLSVPICKNAEEVSTASGDATGYRCSVIATFCKGKKIPMHIEGNPNWSNIIEELEATVRAWHSARAKGKMM